MNRLAIIVAVVAIVIGTLTGYLWWGLPTTRLQSELQDVRTRADGLEQQLGQLRSDNQRLEAQLKAEKSRLEAAEQDLRREKETSARLQVLVSQGRK
jgi:septal ring factor EnvC (AmiA/AmiB activator)